MLVQVSGAGMRPACAFVPPDTRLLRLALCADAEVLPGCWA